jgi:hypothetical protein
MALSRASKRARGASAGGEPCPVCFEPVTDPSVFPCGHVVCGACNAQLERRAFLACPTCRTPRAGVSVREVNAAAERRVLADEHREAAEADNSAYLTITRAGQRFNVMFFPTEDRTNPMLTIGSRLRPAGRGASRWSGRIQLSDHAAIRAAVAQLGGAPADDDDGRDGDAREQSVRDAEGAPATATTPPASTTPLNLTGPMAALVDGLLRPVGVPEYLALREAAR